MQAVVLGSTSKYRASLLGRLKIPFTTAAPDCDETPLAGEAPAELARRLGQAKALSLASNFPQAIIIGSDQVAALGERVLGKPGGRTRAIEQLQAMQGHSIAFHTSLYVHDAATGRACAALDTTTAVMRPLTSAEIERYVDIDEPYDCAGSFKVESVGISLFERIDSSDPSALVGLPLLALSRCLRELGVPLLR